MSCRCCYLALRHCVMFACVKVDWNFGDFVVTGQERQRLPPDSSSHDGWFLSVAQQVTIAYYRSRADTSQSWGIARRATVHVPMYVCRLASCSSASRAAQFAVASMHDARASSSSCSCSTSQHQNLVPPMAAELVSIPTSMPQLRCCIRAPGPMSQSFIGVYHDKCSTRV